MSAILDAFEIRWQPLLGCVGLGLLWCQDKDERKLVMGAGAVLVVALGRIATDGADWMSLTAVCSVAGYTLFERFTKLPGKMEPEGVWTAPTKAAKPSEGRKAHARLCAGGQVYSGDPPKAVDHTVGDAIVIEAVAAAAPPNLRALTETALLNFGPRLLWAAFRRLGIRHLRRQVPHPRLGRREVRAHGGAQRGQRQLRRERGAGARGNESFARARAPRAAATRRPLAENQEFSQLITGIVEVLDSNAQRIEKAKLKAIGMRNRVLSERENRDQHRRALQAMIAEKTAELERYQIQHQSLSQVEAEQRALVDKLGNSEV